MLQALDAFVPVAEGFDFVAGLFEDLLAGQPDYLVVVDYEYSIRLERIIGMAAIQEYPLIYPLIASSRECLNRPAES